MFPTDNVAGHQIIFCPVDANEKRPDELTAIARTNAHFDMRIAEFGLRPGNHDIEKQWYIRAQSESIALNGGDEWLFTFQNIVDDTARLHQRRHFNRRISTEVTTRTERFARTGQHQHP